MTLQDDGAQRCSHRKWLSLKFVQCVVFAQIMEDQMRSEGTYLSENYGIRDRGECNISEG